MTVIFFSNSIWGLKNYRDKFIRGLISKGFKVILVSPYSENDYGFSDIGCEIKYIYLKYKVI